MHFTFVRYAVILLLALVIMGSLFSCVDVVPHSEKGIAKNAQSLEGFEAMDKPYDYHSQDNKAAPEVAMVHGFDQLFKGINNTSETLDKFAAVPGDLNCKAAYGISNSRGPLCFDDETMKLLRTRGGNSATGPSEIGA
jgi:hypothetical protein